MTFHNATSALPPSHFGIAGAGLLGRLLAWQLLRVGHQVTLFDQDTINGEQCAGRVAAAMLAPFSESVCCEHEIFDWGQQSIALWPTLLAQLQQDSGNTVDYQLNGSLVITHQQDQANLHYFNQQLRTRLPEQQAAIEFCQRDKIRELEPELADKFSSATFLSGEGCIDNWALLDNLAIAIQGLGGSWHEQCHVDDASGRTIIANGNRHVFGKVIDCRGVGAKRQLAGLRGVRGEVLWVHAPDVTLSRPIRLMHPRYQLYIAPKPKQRYVIGATEIESESMTAITVRSSLELQSALYSVHSGFAEASIIRAFANCRPAFIDNLPRIDCKQGFMSINGLYRHGYLLAPMVIQTALAAITGDQQHAIVHSSITPSAAAL